MLRTRNKRTLTPETTQSNKISRYFEPKIKNERTDSQSIPAQAIEADKENTPSSNNATNSKSKPISVPSQPELVPGQISNEVKQTEVIIIDDSSAPPPTQVVNNASVSESKSIFVPLQPEIKPEQESNEIKQKEVIPIDVSDESTDSTNNSQHTLTQTSSSSQSLMNVLPSKQVAKNASVSRLQPKFGSPRPGIKKPKKTPSLMTQQKITEFFKKEIGTGSSAFSQRIPTQALNSSQYVINARSERNKENTPPNTQVTNNTIVPEPQPRAISPKPGITHEELKELIALIQNTDLMDENFHSEQMAVVINMIRFYGNYREYAKQLIFGGEGYQFLFAAAGMTLLQNFKNEMMKQMDSFLEIKQERSSFFHSKVIAPLSNEFAKQILVIIKIIDIFFKNLQTTHERRRDVTNIDADKIRSELVNVNTASLGKLMVLENVMQRLTDNQSSANKQKIQELYQGTMPVRIKELFNIVASSIKLLTQKGLTSNLIVSDLVAFLMTFVARLEERYDVFELFYQRCMRHFDFEFTVIRYPSPLYEEYGNWAANKSNLNAALVISSDNINLNDIPGNYPAKLEELRKIWEFYRDAREFNQRLLNGGKFPQSLYDHANMRMWKAELEVLQLQTKSIIQNEPRSRPMKSLALCEQFNRQLIKIIDIINLIALEIFPKNSLENYFDFTRESKSLEGIYKLSFEKIEQLKSAISSATESDVQQIKKLYEETEPAVMQKLFQFIANWIGCFRNDKITPDGVVADLAIFFIKFIVEYEHQYQKLMEAYKTYMQRIDPNFSMPDLATPVSDALTFWLSFKTNGRVLEPVQPNLNSVVTAPARAAIPAASANRFFPAANLNSAAFGFRRLPNIEMSDNSNTVNQNTEVVNNPPITIPGLNYNK